jgi:hypothetical protein
MEISDKILIVKVPVADLRRKPVDAKPLYIHDDLQETQVLYNEMLLYVDEIDDWYYVEAIEQQKYTLKNKWQGYPGWIRKGNVTAVNVPMAYNAVVKSKTAPALNGRSEKSDVLLTVSIGTRFTVRKTSDKEYYSVVLADNKRGYIKKDNVAGVEKYSNESILRKAIVSTGRLFIGAPYLWGGKSMFMAELSEERQKAVDKRQRAGNLIVSIRNSKSYAVNTGVDCSGLTSLIYRVHNIDIPRDAHGQWIAAQKVPWDRIKPGDLIFVSAEGDADSISHVMLSIGGERFIETADTGGAVKINNFTNKFGESSDGLAAQDFFFCNKQIYFGRIISEQ